MGDWNDVLGLSPRVRGNHAGAPCNPQHRGSIPACAGEPLRRKPTGTADRVYPRVCGGTTTTAGADGRAAGLSPRVRGNRASGLDGPSRRGSIPACAGEPDRIVRAPVQVGVYPRVCGGTSHLEFPAPLCEGLSPRVRGNLPAPVERADLHGSIPACAGEPSSSTSTALCRGVYPRVCGGTCRCSPAR